VVDLGGVDFPVTAGETKKYRWLGRKTDEVLEQVAALTRAGMQDRDLRYLLQRELEYWNIVPDRLDVGADDRARTHLHPAAVGAIIRQSCVVDLRAHRWGQEIEVSRSIVFGEPDARAARLWKDAPRDAG
jgi:hypothetical protein